ncbi:MAG: cation transport regulator [Acidobacteria bacterium]|nr:MAG: cation transport regulator [Acidobacteriota bacterium]PYQ63791.1 MAG: cation transport regulator [Acidobacteriota bacterium]
MPYKSVSDLPAAQVDQYSPHQKKAFLEAFNNAYEEYGGDESRAFAVAHSAAKKAGGSGDRREPERSDKTPRAER